MTPLLEGIQEKCGHREVKSTILRDDMLDGKYLRGECLVWCSHCCKVMGTVQAA